MRNKLLSAHDVFLNSHAIYMRIKEEMMNLRCKFNYNILHNRKYKQFNTPSRGSNTFLHFFETIFTL